MPGHERDPGVLRVWRELGRYLPRVGLRATWTHIMEVMAKQAADRNPQKPNITQLYRMMMARYILEVKDTLGTAMILVEHDMHMVMDIADRVMVLDFGQVIAVGDLAREYGGEWVSCPTTTFCTFTV